jgi:hypothetical protein
MKKMLKAVKVRRRSSNKKEERRSTRLSQKRMRSIVSMGVKMMRMKMEKMAIQSLLSKRMQPRRRKSQAHSLIMKTSLTCSKVMELKMIRTASICPKWPKELISQQ